MFVDTHCHIDTYEELAKESFEDLLKRLQNPEFAFANLPKPISDSLAKENAQKIKMPDAFIHVACSPNDFEYGKTISEKYPFVYVAYGIHPEYIENESLEDEKKLTEFLKHPKCVSCGEFGLDYHYGKDSREKQIALFERHLQIAIESNKTLTLHLRDADDDAIAILKQTNLKNKNVHVHCFTGDSHFMERLLTLDCNLFIGFTGVITFKNAQNIRDAATLVPIQQLLLETDAPYLAPVPFRGNPSHSGYIPFIAEKLAELKQTNVDEIFKQCRKNTQRCYGI